MLPFPELAAIGRAAIGRSIIATTS